VAPTTYNVFEVRAELRNEVTGEPHLHIYTTDFEEAQAFYWTLKEFLGGRWIDYFYHENVWEGTVIDCCTGCEAARECYGREYATW
jgi:hypothetical protein